MKMFLTRLGENSIMVVTGDLTQIDLPEGKKSGLKNAVTVLKDVKDIAIRFFVRKGRRASSIGAGDSQGIRKSRKKARSLILKNRLTKNRDILYGGVCRFLRAAYGVLPAAFRKKIR